MYLSKLHIKNVKLLRDVKIDFTGKDGRPRPFTVFVGENGLCKTSLLQAIALAASGADRANQVADVSSYPDLRRPAEPVEINAIFSFSQAYHADRTYPGLEEGARRPKSPPWLESTIGIEPGLDVFNGFSDYVDRRGESLHAKDRASLVWKKNGAKIPPRLQLDPLRHARGSNLMHWFVAGYGVGRTLPAPASVTAEEIASPSRDRLMSLFKVGTRIIGTGFADILPAERAAAFNAHLQQAFVQHGLLPHAKAFSLQARGNINIAMERGRAHRLTLALGAREEIDVPTIWLSQGYQAMIAWVADLVGQVWWEAEKQVIPLDDMEGICLIDEIDLHLHPTWQAGLISGLRSAFPKIQFIATTHSPMVLPGLKQHEVFRLEQDDEGNVIASQAKETPALMTGSALYRRFFGIEHLEPRELDNKLFEFATLASYAGRSATEDKKVWRLLEELRSAGIDPGFEPVARESTSASKPRPRQKRPVLAATKSPRRKGS